MLLFVIIDMRTLRESLVAYFRAAYTSGSLDGLNFYRLRWLLESKLGYRRNSVVASL